MARQRLGTEPRSVLGAPLILANNHLQGGHLVIQIVKRHGNLQETPVLIADGMTDEPWQEWHDDVTWRVTVLLGSAHDQHAQCCVFVIA